MNLSASNLVVSWILALCNSLSIWRLHIGYLYNVYALRRSKPAYHSTYHKLPSREYLQNAFPSHHGRSLIANHGKCAFLGSAGTYVRQSVQRKETSVRTNALHTNHEVFANSKDEETTSSISLTRNLICRLRDELFSIDDHASCVAKLVSMGAELYRDAPEPSVLYTPQRRLEEFQQFHLPTSCGDQDMKRPFFLFNTTQGAQYKLIKGCISSVYVSVHVDKDQTVHLDGTADSLITKAMLALILDSIEGLSIDSVMQLRDIDVYDNSTLKRIGIIRRNGVETILNHIKDEIRSQVSSNVTSTVRSTLNKANAAKRVAVLVSGGVDSSVALWMLKSRGYDVEAFYLKVWGINKADDTGNCEWATDVDYVMRLCQRLQIPLHILPFQELYHTRVIDPFVEGTRCGETPNPDVFCNQFIKFGTFLDYAKLWGFTHVASGHYARVVADEVTNVGESASACKDGAGGRTLVKRLCVAKDRIKDQTYFLCRLNQEQLQHVIFPIGSLLKSEVRDIARTLQFENHDRKDSMGLCFLGKVSVPGFLSGYVGRQPGPIVDYDTQQEIGEHPGLYNFTIGQRGGISKFLSSVLETHKSRHVVRKDHNTNTLYVSSLYNSDKYVSSGGLRRRFNVCDIKWNVPDFYRYTQCGGKHTSGLKLKVRHSPTYSFGNIEFNNAESPDSASVDLFSPDIGIATGQYAVFYAGDECVGSGKMVATAS